MLRGELMMLNVFVQIEDLNGHDGGIIYYQVVFLRSISRMSSEVSSIASSMTSSTMKRKRPDVTGFTLHLSSATFRKATRLSRCVLTYDSIKKTSLTALNDAGWDESFSFPLNPGARPLGLEVLNDEFGLGETHLGRGEIDVKKLSRFTKGRPYRGSAEVGDSTSRSISALCLLYDLFIEFRSAIHKERRLGMSTSV